MKISSVAGVFVGIALLFIALNFRQHLSVSKPVETAVISPDSKKIVVKNVPKIAYLFAGSVRSFVCPRVHWTIKANLIDSLGGDPYSFVRLTTEDNRNQKTGTGVHWTPPYAEGEINETLKLLNPVAVEYYSLSTQLEEMKRLFPDPIHSVFRDNDQRRYSMFFHRCMAYKLVLNYEKEHNMKFDWVVLARLDAAWLEPVYPIGHYVNDRVWMTETGFVMLNDQFMLIPRQFSDYVYDLNTKVKKDVYCLGGPDVEKWKCNSTELLLRRTPLAVVEQTLPYCCPDIMGINYKGFSETIHCRHMEEGKIPIAITRFPVALSRRTENKQCTIECFRLHAYHFKDYLYNYRTKVYKYLPHPSFPDTSGRAISVRDKLMCHLVENARFPWSPLPAATLHTTQDSKIRAQHSIDYSKSLFTQLDSLHPSILMNVKETEAWRIHPTLNTDGCLTLSFLHKNLTWRACNDHSAVHHLRYDPRQVFFLHVITPSRFYPSVDRRGDGLITNTHYGNVSVNTRIQISFWHPVRFEFTGDPKCLTASNLENGATVTAEDCRADLSDPLQLFQSVQPVYELGSHYQSVIGQMRLAKRPSLCVGRIDSVKVLNSWFPAGDRLVLTRCAQDSTLHLVNFEFELVTS